MLDAHETANERHDLRQRRQIGVHMVKMGRIDELTRRGRTSTMSSGTKKMSAFVFLAMEMASLAKSKVAVNTCV